MSLDAIWLPPTDARSSAIFSFSNQDEHVKAAIAVFRKYGVNLQLYALDPMPPVDFGDREPWASQHQALHKDLDSVLGFGDGPDLVSVNWRDPEQVKVWVQLHGPRHMLYAQVLGLT